MNPKRCIPLLLFSAILLAVSDDAPPPPTADCTLSLLPAHRSGSELWHRLSQSAELVAPSAAPSTGKRRVVTPPPSVAFEAKNFIDTEVFGKMVKNGIHWTTASSDAELLRRVTLDLTGEIPDPDTVKAFLADPSADKRDRAIDRLLKSDAFVDRWTMWLGDLVQNVAFASNNNEIYGARNAYWVYLRQSIQTNKPYDQIVRELIAGSGRQFTNGEVNHWVRELQPNGPIQDTYDNLSATTGSRFLALPLQCISCHNGLGHLEQSNSALAKRTRYDFWRNAAFFAQVTTKVEFTPRSAELILSDNTTGAYELNTTSGNKTPRVPINGQATVDPAFFLTGEGPRDGEPRRVAYGRILTAHPQFARATVNYLWKELFGLGIVEPTDSFDLLRQDPATLPAGATLQPTHPALLTQLASYFSTNNYDLRAILKLMVSSNAYQLASRYDGGAWNDTYTPYFARHYPRRLMAEELLDAVFKVTNQIPTVTASGDLPFSKMMMLPDPLEGGPYATMLNNFGRGNRDDQPRTSESSIVQALKLMNDPIITDRIKSTASGSTLQKLLGSTKDPGTIADSLYLAVLSRYPSGPERAVAIEYLGSGDVAKQSETLQLALINRLDFLFY